MANNPIVRVEFTTGKQSHFPVTSAVSGPPVNPPFGISGYTASAVFAGTVNVTFTTASVGTAISVSGSASLSSWPASIVVGPKANGAATVGVSLANTVPQLLIGLPYTVLTFGSGSPLYGASVGVSSYTLQPGRTYASPGVSFTLTAMVVQAYTNPLTVPIAVQAVLYGIGS